MNKIMKSILIGAGAIAALIAVLLIVLVTVVDPNDYKDQITEIVKEKTGRTLTLGGDIGFSFFPWLGLTVDDVSLSNAEGFSSDTMVHVGKAGASLQIMPLFSGEVRVGTVYLDQLSLNLAKDANGRSNWDDLVINPEGSSSKSEKAPSASSKEETAGSDIKEISLEGVSITRASVSWEDRQNAQKATLDNLSLTVGEIGNGKQFPFELSFDLTLEKPKINTRPVLSGLAALDMKAGTFSLSQLTVKALNASLNGTLSVLGLKDAPAYSGSLELAEMSPRKLLKELNMQVPETADESVLTSASAKLDFKGSTSRASLDSATLKLDDTTITCFGKVTDFSNPAISFTANVDAIDADRYLPPKKQDDEGKTKDTAEKETRPAAKPAQEPDLSAIRELDLTAKLTVDSAKAMNIKVSDFTATLRAKSGIITLDPLSVNLYEGSAKNVFSLNVNGQKAVWNEKVNASGIQAGPLLKDFMGKDVLLGTATSKADIRGAGLTPDSIKNSLSGTASFAFENGAINGINIAKMIRDAYAALTGKPSSGDEPLRTDFAELLGSAVMKNGHITNNDLLMKSPLLRLNGEGWADLPKDAVDYLATVTVVGTLKGQEGESIEDLKGLPLPVRAKGSLQDPSVGLDTKALAEALFGDKIKKGKKKLENTLRDAIMGSTRKKDSKATDGGNATTDDKKSPASVLKGLFQ